MRVEATRRIVNFEAETPGNRSREHLMHMDRVRDN